MKKALISPIEVVETGFRVAETAQSDFPIAPPLFWVDCSDEVEADRYWFDPVNSEFRAIVFAEPLIEQPVSEGAQTL